MRNKGASFLFETRRRNLSKLVVDSESIQLRTGADGSARVGATRVTLDTAVARASRWS